jgi:diguanylate cyclase (GGDEF)-like protein/PAS domain S-box-containing protein
VDEVVVEPRVLAQLLHHTSDLVGVLDADGTVKSILPHPPLGHPPEDILGHFALELIHPDDFDDAARRMLEALSTPGVTAPFECRLHHGDGSWRWYDIVGTNLLDDPDVGGFVFYGRDISERKQSEETVRVSERRWHRLLRNSTEIVSVLAHDGTVILSSSEDGILGYEDWVPENMRKTALELLHPDDVALAIENFAKIAAVPGPHPPLVARIRHADGSWHWTEAFANNLLEDPDVKGIIVTTRDVTQRMEAVLALKDETRTLETLQAIGQRLAAELDLDTLLQEVTDAATKMTDAAFGAFFYNAHGPDGESYLLYTLSGAPREAFARFGMPRKTALFGPTFDGTGPVRVHDVKADPRYGLSAPHHGMPPGHLAVRSYLAVPVVSRGGEVLGGLFFGHPEPGVFTERGERLAEGIAAHAAVAIDNARLFQAAQEEIAARKQAEAELAHQASHDPLTGLPNRVLLVDRLSQAVARIGRERSAVAVLLLDLDRFKVVNDSLGHATGDRLLVAVAERLLATVRPGDTVARLGGDEFIIVCESVHGQIDAVGVADRIAHAFDAHFQIGDHELGLAVSIGIAVATDQSRDPDSLLRDADTVMYRAKGRGGNRWEIFDEALREQVVERLRIETELRRAIERDEVGFHLQPIVSLTTDHVIGVEGLARWDHNMRGVVLPSGFIRVAEESGLVIPLGRRAIAEACRQLADWANAPDTFHLTLSVNVSSRQLLHTDLAGDVTNALESSGVRPRQLVLEITERALMEDIDGATAVLHKLQSLGVQLWVDDFGTGYSSLTSLRRLPLAGLKIDQSFVAGLATEAEDRVIVAGIVSLAHSLGLAAVAEGVETSEQAATLRDLGCDMAQGHLWSPALPASDLHAWLPR